MKVLKVKRHQQVTPRTFTVELTEGEMDAILGMTRYFTGSKNSPYKYIHRLRARLVVALGCVTRDTHLSRLADIALDGEDFIPVELADYDEL